MTAYFRPLPQTGLSRPADALPIAGGWTWFTHVALISRAGPGRIMPVADVPQEVLQAISAPRPALLSLDMTRPALMGILNVTPDSFSDGGQFTTTKNAVQHGLAMQGDGADMIDIGGESTRPGADFVPATVEIERTEPVIAKLANTGGLPISIDTRKSKVAAAAIKAGATMINDVSALRFDDGLIDIAVENQVPVCLMHAQGDPKTMQQDPVYKSVLLDVYDDLSARVSLAVAAGLPRHLIVVDPGIGFGKTVQHNLTLLQNLSLFHGLGCPILLGASRKRFIGNIGNAQNASERMPGSIAVTLAGLAQGVQIHRIHDVKETRQAISLWMAVTGAER